MEGYPPQEVSNITGIEVKTLYEIARLYAGADKALSAWTIEGVNQSSIGTDTVSAICNLALITGNLGREGAAPFLSRDSAMLWGLESLGLQAQSQDIETLQTQKIESFASIIGVSPDEITKGDIATRKSSTQ